MREREGGIAELGQSEGAKGEGAEEAKAKAMS